MKKLLFALLALTVVAAGCAVTDYPVITDTRGDYSGVIRTGHKAFIIPSGQIATIWPDGSDELFSLVYQNQYGDQRLYTFNNFDPTGAVNFLDQTYCDWRYEGCEAVQAVNNTYGIDDVFDYQFFPDCSGARSLSLLVSYSSRPMGECGDRIFDAQGLAGEFANLATTTYRGAPAYVVPFDASNFSVTLNNESMPIFGSYNALLTDRLQMLVPMTPNARHQLAWLSEFASENGNRVDAAISYNSLSATISLALAPNGLNYNLSRF